MSEQLQPRSPQFNELFSAGARSPPPVARILRRCCRARGGYLWTSDRFGKTRGRRGAIADRSRVDRPSRTAAARRRCSPTGARVSGPTGRSRRASADSHCDAPAARGQGRHQAATSQSGADRAGSRGACQTQACARGECRNDGSDGANAIADTGSDAASAALDCGAVGTCAGIPSCSCPCSKTGSGSGGVAAGSGGFSRTRDSRYRVLELQDRDGRRRVPARRGSPRHR